MTSARAAAAEGEPLIGPIGPPGVHVMTYNIRRRFAHSVPGSPDRWADRRPLLARTLMRERPALLGVQEALPSQATAVLRALGEGYRRAGHGRNSNGEGEGCPIFWDDRRLQLIDWQQLALSDSPSVAGSRSFGNRIPRIAVSARFADRATGRPLHLINTHFDHISKRSRLKSAEMIRDLAADSHEPVIVTGDMNAGIGTEPYRAMTDGDVLDEVWTVAATRLTPEWGTYSAYRAPRRGRRIDWMLVGGGVQVDSVAIGTARYAGRAASDHEPLQAVVRW